jgi:hypothetical protein
MRQSFHRNHARVISVLASHWIALAGASGFGRPTSPRSSAHAVLLDRYQPHFTKPVGGGMYVPKLKSTRSSSLADELNYRGVIGG